MTDTVQTTKLTHDPVVQAQGACMVWRLTQQKKVKAQVVKDLKCFAEQCQNLGDHNSSRLIGLVINEYEQELLVLYGGKEC